MAATVFQSWLAKVLPQVLSHMSHQMENSTKPERKLEQSKLKFLKETKGDFFQFLNHATVLLPSSSAWLIT